jgi:hypothetical protein
MQVLSSRKIVFVSLCILSVALTVQAQQQPVFVPGKKVSTLSQSFKVLAADINNNGFADLVSLESTPSSSKVVIYLGNGDGTFQAPFSVLDGGAFVDLAIGDFDQDGNLDLAIATNTGNSPQTAKGEVNVIFGNGQGVFGRRQTYQVGGVVSGIAAGDFNNDGLTDLAVLGTSNRTVTLLTNTHGAFSKSSFTVPTHFDTTNPGFKPDFLSSIVAGDFNADGKMDLLYQDSCGDSGCVVSQEAYFLLTNTGSGFTPKLANVASTGAGPLHVADFDGDGRADFYFAFNGCHTPCNGVVVEFSNGDGTFQAVNASNGDSSPGAGDPFDVIAGDFNNDGILDIAAATISEFAVNPGMDILLGKGGRNGFANPFHIDTPNPSGSPFRIAAGFLDHSGSTDIVLMENGDFIPFLNKTTTAHDPCPYPTGPGINFCLPANGATAGSPVNFVGSFHAPTQPANRIELWIDGKKKFQVFGDLISTSMQVSPGTHTATLVGVSATGRFIKSNHSFTVSGTAGCLPSSPGVRVCTPAPNASVPSPVEVAAGAIPTAQRITAIRIYVDNQPAFFSANGSTANSFSIDAHLTLAAGGHHLVVVAYQNNGTALTASETITVR